MKLIQLIENIESVTGWGGSEKIEVTGLAYDSRQVQAGQVFFALRGVKSDGAKFAKSAAEQGAVAIVAEKFIECGIPVLVVPDARVAMAEMAANFYAHPSKRLKVIGITGTNGKTTTAFLCRHILDTATQRCGLVGTIKYIVGDTEIDAPHTTPESPDLQYLLAQMRDAGDRCVAMEVSSHALAQSRADAIAFDATVFTNLTQDHLDYHETMEDYFDAKAQLFEKLATSEKKKPRAIVNSDDRYGRMLIDRLGKRVPVWTYGHNVHCDFRASDVRFGRHGTQFRLTARKREYLVRLPLIGSFNVSNALAALAATAAIGIEIRAAVTALSHAPQVPGRLERVPAKRHFQVFVDYAHTDDALRNAIVTLRTLNPARIITVAGCGGDRDKAKRPLMAGAATELSDFCIFTTDNPRSEDPAEILADMRKGARGSRFEEILDRKEAIHHAIALAEAGDMILIAGKGHETYQEVHGVRTAFDDVKVAHEAIAAHLVEIEIEPEPTEEDYQPEPPLLEEGVQE